LFALSLLVSRSRSRQAHPGRRDLQQHPEGEGHMRGVRPDHRRKRERRARLRLERRQLPHGMLQVRPVQPEPRCTGSPLHLLLLYHLLRRRRPLFFFFFFLFFFFFFFFFFFCCCCFFFFFFL